VRFRSLRRAGEIVGQFSFLGGESGFLLRELMVLSGKFAGFMRLNLLIQECGPASAAMAVETPARASLRTRCSTARNLATDLPL
jgi:hypothetical protein